MAYHPCITLNSVSCRRGDTLLFENLSLTCMQQTIGLIGNNGSGKTSLLRLILGTLLPFSGTVTVQGVVAYCPQTSQISTHRTVAQALGVHEQLQALDKILSGKDCEDALIVLDDQWALRDNIAATLNKFGLGHLNVFMPLNRLSGGEQLRALLACVLMGAKLPQLLILDEPTNHLDLASLKCIEKLLYDYPGALLVISHDRKFLENIGVTREIHAPFRKTPENY